MYRILDIIVYNNINFRECDEYGGRVVVLLGEECGGVCGDCVWRIVCESGVVF